MWFHFASPSIGNISLKNIWANNNDNNNVTQANKQAGKVSGWWESGGVKNVVRQTASNVQEHNDSFNDIDIDTNAEKSNVSLWNIGASNIVNNTLVQANDQTGTVWGGWGGVSNGAWQSSTNNQSHNDAFNDINIDLEI